MMITDSALVSINNYWFWAIVRAR